ncbi:MAG: ester cyclase [Actinobacteria bacterium]|nr:ester cyclase [Actinomycetota bacterium]
MTNTTTHTTTESNTQTALRFLELICNADTGPAVEDVVHPDYVNHHMSLRGHDGFREIVERVNTTFADVKQEPLDVIASEDRVVARTRMTALHVGDYQGIAPTNRTIEMSQVHIWRIEDGRVIEHWPQLDQAGAMRQMGAL